MGIIGMGEFSSGGKGPVVGKLDAPLTLDTGLYIHDCVPSRSMSVSRVAPERIVEISIIAYIAHHENLIIYLKLQR